MLVKEVTASNRRWPHITVPNPRNGASYGFQNYKKPFNVFKRRTGGGECLYYNEAFEDLGLFKKSEKEPYEYTYNLITGRITKRIVGQGGVGVVVETSIEKNGTDGQKQKPIGKPNDSAHAWAVVSQDYAKIKEVKK